jgi:DNA-directed RNA polymerase subunit RPC12/RpoP
MNFKRKKPKDHAKEYRNGTDGYGCPYCGSNWLYKNYIKKRLIELELELD